ncbi:MAG: copper ion binding protein, partial [Dehalococcoidales bacterium]|nr:copper ion binding protein [Dehalococcoidales bacterium]
MAKKIILPVTGMTCASCADTIEKGLSKLPGVSEVNVNVASEKASIEYDPSQVDTKALMDTISNVGYGVAVGKITFSVRGMTCASCVANIEKALAKVPGVISANVNLATEKAAVHYLEGEASMADFMRAVESAGYAVVGEKEEGKVDEDIIKVQKARRLFISALIPE